MNSVFDSITNSEQEMIRRANIKEGQVCLYLRAYIIIRLLFNHEFVITDSSINLNRALRTLIVSNEAKLRYDVSKLPPADFGKLIENGCIKLAARDIYKGSFSESLRNAQHNKKHVDLPGKRYTNYIDEICKEENIYWWNAEEVSQMFTRKIKTELETQFSDDINIFLRELTHRLSDQETLTYNMVKNEVFKMNYKEKSEEYQIVRTMLRNSYDYNIPEVLRLDYFRDFYNTSQLVGKNITPINLTEQYDFPWRYAFNIYAFALLPVRELLLLRQSDEYIRYEEAMTQYMEGATGISSFLAVLEGYLNYLDCFFVDLYKDTYTDNRPKNLIMRFREQRNNTHPVILTMQVGLAVYDAVTIVNDIRSDPVSGILKVLLTTILPNIVVKGYEYLNKPLDIKQAIIKID